MANKVWNIDRNEVRSAEGAVIEWDDHKYFTLTYGKETFHGEVMEERIEANYLKIKINHRVFEVSRKGELDELIAALGMDKPKIKKLKELAAPMPGRIVNIEVNIGDQLEPGDAILSLEAMKMENVLKAEGVGTVKAICVNKEDVVDKGSILIEFE
jgi:biotin carboxyl carrier protein